MAEIAKAQYIRGPASDLLPANDRISELRAGEALGSLDACTIRADGLVYRASGAAADANARVRGFAADAYGVNDPVTLLHNCNIGYGTALTPGQDLFVSATVPGGLANAATTGGTAPIAFVVDATRVRILAAK